MLTVIRCVRGTRPRSRAVLLTQCQEAGLDVVLCEGTLAEPPRDNWRRFLLMASAHIGDVLHLEDDAYLCPGFLAALTDRVAKRSFNVLTLYSNHKADTAAVVAGRKTRRLTYSEFSGTVGFLMDASLAPFLLACLPDWEASNPHHSDACDYHLRDFCRRERLLIQAAVPSLVQHRPGPSVLGHSPGRYRHSRTYRAAFGEVPPC